MGFPTPKFREVGREVARLAEYFGMLSCEECYSTSGYRAIPVDYYELVDGNDSKFFF